ncbi:dTDP-4-dehydrorhamnose reductase [Alicyclobacillus macrosporangiidus]|uniref:dTDP-4-dehydrorhamnose reductase n=1 Tax=Alicyclobacillus macrosporangiidus TaxID=392015 RepID=UPI0004971147|nr:dTDP-4-dehydrorhamnose reductase [Alicyclobacillus macrosporangiidus]
MKVLICGAYGQLGRELLRFTPPFADVSAFGRKELDVADYNQVLDAVNEIKPDAIINVAAYTAVDLAEQEEDHAYLVNANGSRNLAVAAEQVGAKYCYVSTDYVFDGLSTMPYREYDMTSPMNVYGRSKRAGEILAQTLTRKYFIVRTSWLYGMHGSNFVKTMIRLGREGGTVRVVNDQTGSPTYAVHLAKFIWKLVATDRYGIYHATNSGCCTWYEFARAIFEECELSADVEPCSTKDFPRPAPRPAYSVLDHMQIRINGFPDLPHWRAGLREFIQELKDNALL